LPVASVDIASGSDHLVILSQDGSVFTIGRAQEGQLGRVSERTSTGESRRGVNELLTAKRVQKKAANFIASAVWAAPYGTFLKEMKTGCIYACGLNSFNQLGMENNEKQLEFFPKLNNFSNVLLIAGGIYHTVVLTGDHKVFTVGRKDFGFLGLGKLEQNITELTNLASLNIKKITSITCGECNSFALTTEGKLYVWGMGTNFQLGTGDEEDVLEPQRIASGQLSYKKALTASSGGQHSLFVVEVPENSSEKVKVKKTVRFSLDTPTSSKSKPSNKLKV
jgi:regulator of chromosome condensation